MANYDFSLMRFYLPIILAFLLLLSVGDTKTYAKTIADRKGTLEERLVSKQPVLVALIRAKIGLVKISNNVISNRLENKCKMVTMKTELTVRELMGMPNVSEYNGKSDRL